MEISKSKLPKFSHGGLVFKLKKEEDDTNSLCFLIFNLTYFIYFII